MLGQTHLLQDIYADLLFLTQTVFHKPYDVPSFAQQRLHANSLSWPACKSPLDLLPDPSWMSFARHGACSDKHTCCKIPMRICFFDLNGVPQTT